MPLLHLIVIISFSIFTIFNLYNLIKLQLSLKFLQDYYKLLNCNYPKKLPDIIVIIPVLHEEEKIEKTLKHMLAFNYKKDKLNFLIITTEKERLQKKECDTIDIVKELSKKYEQVAWLHYPYTTGCKSDQLNFAIDKFKELYPAKNPEDTFFAIYDADSVPNKYTLKIFSLELAKYQDANVFQQSAIFLKNFENIDRKPFFSRYFLKTAAINQTMFTLAHEIPRILRFKRNKFFIDKITYAHCVGHGLFVRLSFLKKIKFPNNYYPEDMFYGFILNAIKESINPIPVLDCSDIPETIADMFKQKASWFYGLLKSEFYRKFVKENFSSLYFKDSLRIMLISTSSLFDAVRWFIKSFLAIILIIVSIILGSFYFVLVFTFLFSYVSAFYLILKNYSMLLEIAGKKKSLRPRDKLPILFFSLLYLLIHSLPAYYATARVILECIKFHNSKTNHR